MTESEQYYFHYSMQYFLRIKLDSRLNLSAFEESGFDQRLGFHRSRDLMMFSDLEAGSSALRTRETALIKVCMVPLAPSVRSSSSIAQLCTKLRLETATGLR